MHQSLSLFRTDGEVAVFVRESASLVTGKTDTVTRLRLLGPEIGLIVRLRMNTNAKPSLSSIHYKLSLGLMATKPVRPGYPAMDCCITGSSLIAVTRSTYSVISAPEICIEIVL